MKQCKLCGSPLGNDPSTDELDKHWKKHHNWHWESNKEKTRHYNQQSFFKVIFIVLNLNEGFSDLDI